MQRDIQSSVDERVDELLDMMTLEEMILQTDQYFSPDFMRGTGHGETRALDMERVRETLKGNSVGSIQARGMTPEETNALQRYAVEETRLGIPILF